MSVVLLTGATGFIGRHIHRDLVRRGHAVRVTVRPGGAGRLAVPVAADAILETDDIFARDADWWSNACRGVDAVIHAAWYVEHGLYPDAAENAACVKGSIALAEGATRAGVPHVIGIGTCMEYRLPGEHLSVDAELDPQNFYAACKLATFHMMRAWFAQQDTAFSWARLFYLHGEGEHPDRLAAYLHRRLAAGEPAALSAGTQLRDFLDVTDAAAMIAGVVDTGQTGPINICSGRPVTIRAFAERIADGYGRRDLLHFSAMPPRPSDPAAVVGVCNVEQSAGLLESLNESAA
ncbi:MAG TPA: NAD(P)-dependent oxidoreductase [Sphingobium sp.]